MVVIAVFLVLAGLLVIAFWAEEYTRECTFQEKPPFFFSTCRTTGQVWNWDTVSEGVALIVAGILVGIAGGVARSLIAGKTRLEVARDSGAAQWRSRFGP